MHLQFKPVHEDQERPQQEDDNVANMVSSQQFGENQKFNLSLPPQSLYRLTSIDPVREQPKVPTASQQENASNFHPVDICNDLSLKDILDLSEDYLREDHLQEEAEEACAYESSIINPTPLNIPSNHNVASHALAQEQRATYFGFNGNSTTTTSTNMPVQNNYFPGVNMMMPHPHPAPHSFMPAPANAPHLEVRHQPVTTSESPSGDDFDDLFDDGPCRFRPYQEEQWAQHFRALCLYRERTGNCLVPHGYKENLPLARWVKRQRYLHKLMMEGKPSCMTEDRVRALEQIGFVWDSQGATWEERFVELCEFRRTYRHSNVPSNYGRNHKLAVWVKCQRRQYKLFKEGKHSCMTQQRIKDLESIGFEWLLRRPKKKKKKNQQQKEQEHEQETST